MKGKTVELLKYQENFYLLCTIEMESSIGDKLPILIPDIILVVVLAKLKS